MRLRLLALILITPSLALTACDTLEGGLESEGLVEEVGADHLVVEAIRYGVTAETVYEGYTGLADVKVGDTVEVDYEDRSGERVATDIDAVE